MIKQYILKATPEETNAIISAYIEACEYAVAILNCDLEDHIPIVCIRCVIKTANDKAKSHCVKSEPKQ